MVYCGHSTTWMPFTGLDTFGYFRCLAWVFVTTWTPQQFSFRISSALTRFHEATPMERGQKKRVIIFSTCLGIEEGWLMLEFLYLSGNVENLFWRVSFVLHGTKGRWVGGYKKAIGYCTAKLFCLLCAITEAQKCIGTIQGVEKVPSDRASRYTGGAFSLFRTWMFGHAKTGWGNQWKWKCTCVCALTGHQPIQLLVVWSGAQPEERGALYHFTKTAEWKDTVHCLSYHAIS